MGAVIVLNTVGREGRWVFEQLARDGRLAVILEHSASALQLALRTGGLVGLDAPDAKGILDAVATERAQVAVIVLTLDEETELPASPHRWVALNRPGALKRLHAAIEQNISELDATRVHPLKASPR